MAETTLVQNAQVLVAQKTYYLLLLQAQELEAQTAVALWDGLNFGGRVTPIHLS